MYGTWAQLCDAAAKNKTKTTTTTAKNKTKTATATVKNKIKITTTTAKNKTKTTTTTAKNKTKTVTAAAIIRALCECQLTLRAAGRRYRRPFGGSFPLASPGKLSRAARLLTTFRARRPQLWFGCPRQRSLHR